MAISRGSTQEPLPPRPGEHPPSERQAEIGLPTDGRKPTPPEGQQPKPTPGT